MDPGPPPVDRNPAARNRFRRRPVIYRMQVLVWLAGVAVAVGSVALFVPGTGQRVLAFIILGLGVVAAAFVWRVGEYRVHRLGPITSTGSLGWIFAGTFVMVLIARRLGDDSTVGGFVAGMSTALVGVTPLLAYATALTDPPADPTSTPDDTPPTAER